MPEARRRRNRQAARCRSPKRTRRSARDERRRGLVTLRRLERRTFFAVVRGGRARYAAGGPDQRSAHRSDQGLGYLDRVPSGSRKRTHVHDCFRQTPSIRGSKNASAACAPIATEIYAAKLRRNIRSKTAARKLGKKRSAAQREPASPAFEIRRRTACRCGIALGAVARAGALQAGMVRQPRRRRNAAFSSSLGDFAVKARHSSGRI